MKACPLLLLLLLPAATAVAASSIPSPEEQAALQSSVVAPTLEVIAHDPVMARHGDTYYLFTTGPGITVWSSEDMETWTRENAVFDPFPAWAAEEVPGFNGHIWAPDISYHDGLYYLYYSISAFGKNTSCIGLATNRTLDPEDPEFEWVDRGMVIQSFPGVHNWNAIDPNIIEDENGTPYMSFGSFWGGLKLVELTPDRTALAEGSDELLTIATRKPTSSDSAAPFRATAGDNAIEAPFIFEREGSYYLFASIDYCCRGEDSTYKMIVGRADNVKGPYFDRENHSLNEGGGTILLAGNERWNGVGHNAVVHFDGTDYLVFHGYDANDNGRPKLRIEPLNWDAEGWPSVNDAR